MRRVKISDLGQGFPFDGPIEGSALDEGMGGATFKMVSFGSNRNWVRF